MDPERRAKLALLMTNYVQLTPTGPYKFTIVESRRKGEGRTVGFRENMDIKFLRPHEIIASVDTSAGGVHAVANGSEAKIADSMLRVLHQQGVLGDAAADLRFNMRPGGNPERRDFGGVFEAFTAPGSGGVDLRNRFGERVEVDRAGTKVDLTVPLEFVERSADPAWRAIVAEWLTPLARELAGAGGASIGRLFGPDDPLPAAAIELVEITLARASVLSFEDYRFLVECALPAFAAAGEAHRAAALRVLTELRKRLAFADLGLKALSSMEYLTDGGRAADGSAEGGIYRLLDGVAPLFAARSERSRGGGRYGRLTLRTRDDLCPPDDPSREVLVIDFGGFVGESFRLDSDWSARRCGWAGGIWWATDSAAARATWPPTCRAPTAPRPPAW